jgi:D-alanyl-D-alanine carboxypeptidase
MGISRLVIALPLIAFAGIGTSTVRANEPIVPPTSFDTKAIDAYVARYVQAKEVVGLSLAIARDGKIALAKGYGKGCLEPPRPVDTETRFAIGSVTKQFACAAILQLADDGKLSIHDKVAKYYPDLTRAGEISLYDLMTHASGYPDYYPLDFVDGRLDKPRAVDQIIKDYATGKLDFEPGTRWSYSNTGYHILGRVVERVSGVGFAAFVERRIFQPAGMTQTLFEPEGKERDLAVGYTSFALGPVEAVRPEAKGWLYTAGGIASTATDLAKWDLALMEGKLLNPESFRQMIEPRRLASGKSADYGCGLSLGRIAGETVLRHSGAVSGFHALNAMLPRTKSALVLLTNCEHVDLAPLATNLLKLLVDSNDGPNVAVPKIRGLTAKEAAAAFLKQLQSGKVERSGLGDDFNQFLTHARMQSAAARLNPLGEPNSVEVENTAERGGMEVAIVRFKFKNLELRGLMYRTPDGKIQEFLINKT